ncbi:MAG: hypothetical protein KAW01_02730 [Deltaproteobacteria bacterium]|nr:hypothetical protein [Deltaproteobacteria bacterium]
MRLRSILLLILWVFFLQACATPGPQIESLPALSFNAPVNAGAGDYLGLSPGVTTFSLNDVDARVLYSKYGMLPETDQFIKIIKKRSGLK